MAGIHAMPRNEQRAKRKNAHNQERPHGHWWQLGRRFGRKQVKAPVEVTAEVTEAPPIVTEVPEVPTGDRVARRAVASMQDRYPELAVGNVYWKYEGRDDELGVEMVSGQVSQILSDDIRNHLINLFGIVLSAEPSTQLLAGGDAEVSVYGMYEGVQLMVWAAVPAQEREEPIPVVPVPEGDDLPVLYREAKAGFETQGFPAVSADETISGPVEVVAELEEVA
jgi:hypothetical protein